MNTQMNTPGTEDLLRQTLDAKATEATIDLTLEDIRRGAADTRQRSRRRGAVLVAAAAVVAVAVPTALYLRPSDEGARPAPSPSPTASTSPSPTTPAGLESIARGKDPAIAYLHDGLVHEPDGTTSRLPAAANDVTQFTPYHGGWLVIDSVGGIAQYDSSGDMVHRSSQGDSSLAVSADQMRTAFQMDDHIFVGISTGMGEGEIDHPVFTNGRGLVGFLGDRVVYNALPGAVVALDDAGKETSVPGLYLADATSSGSDLVGGLASDQTSGRVVSVTTGKVQWTKDWQPRAFSPDGRYVAAVLAPEPDATDVAILDARSGEVLARVSLQDLGLSQVGTPTWEESDGAVLVDVQDASGQAVLRLARDGKVTLATDVAPSSDMPAWLFATTP